MKKIPIPSNSLHLWFCGLNDPVDPERQKRCREILSSDEIERMERFRFEKHRQQFLLSHAFLRLVLAKYVGRPPSLITFSQNEFGKPALNLSSGQTGVSFNLSHADGLACCVVAKEGDVGIDVESLERSSKGDEIGERFFSATEFADMMALDSEKARHERFFRLWTLKEAFIKAKGTGLTLPLNLFSFSFPKGDKIDIAFNPELQETPLYWKFHLVKPTENHRAAVAIKQHSADQNVLLKMFEFKPFETEKEASFALLGTS